MKPLAGFGGFAQVIPEMKVNTQLHPGFLNHGAKLHVFNLFFWKTPMTMETFDQALMRSGDTHYIREYLFV